jgi:hypothetical protein
LSLFVQALSGAPEEMVQWKGDGKMATREQTSMDEPVQTGRDRTAAMQAEREQASDRMAAGTGMSRPERYGEGDISGRARDTMMSAVSATESVGSGLVGGVSNIAGEVIGVVRDTANTAIDGVGSVGEHAVHTLTGLLVELVGGVRQVAGAAVGGRRPNGRTEREQDTFRAQEASRREQATRREELASEEALH